MKTSIFSVADSPQSQRIAQPDQAARLILAMGEKNKISDPQLLGHLRVDYPQANIILCSTAGEIFADSVSDNTTTIITIALEKTRVCCEAVQIACSGMDSRTAGAALAQKLTGHGKDLCYVLLLSDGSQVNGSELVLGLNDRLPKGIPVTGGLAGDGAAFKSTLIGLDHPPAEGQIVGVGFYGTDLLVSHGSGGGWQSFGPEKKVTGASGNRLYRIEDENALDLYKRYLGRYAADLPGSALLFPLMVRLSPDTAPVVRTILSIDESTGSMQFAGDIPEGSKVRFMKANFDQLVEAASDAAKQAADALPLQPSLSLLVSCVGRKLILADRVAEEVEAVRDVLGASTTIAGFYSYGEIAPQTAGAPCQLHNQTMTITTIAER